MQDIVAALVALLKADAGVAALAGARVFGGELPKTETKPMPRKAIVLEPSGGPSLTAGTFVEHDTQRIDLFAYGETPFEANRLLRTAHAALKPVRRAVFASTLIHWVEPAGGIVSATRDADTAWPRAFQSYQAFYAEQEVA
jgi:hypothetical protein